MTPTLRDLAFNACTALDRASVELREGWWSEEIDFGHESPIDALESVAATLQKVSDRVRRGADHSASPRRIAWPKKPNI